MSEQLEPDSSDGRSVENSGDKPRRKKRGKHKPKPTKPIVNKRQKIKEKYAKAREDAQLAGIINTTPDGAIKPERVDPATQRDAPHPELVATAIRQGWAVPEERKPDLVDELIRILDDPEVPHKVKVAAFNALRMADQQQFERDHPERAAKAKGGAVNGLGSVQVNIQTNVAAAAIIREMIERGELGIIEMPDKSDGAGEERLRGEVEESKAFGDAQ